MRDYGKVAPEFWTGETGRRIRELGRDAQTIALYLITCPSATMLGFYYLPIPTLCHEVGISKQGALKALRSLSEGGFCAYDEPSETVFVINMARFQVGASLTENDNRVKAIRKDAERLRKSPLYAQFHALYGEAFHFVDVSPLEGAPEPHRSQEQEQEQEQNTPRRALRSVAAGSLKGFAEFYEAYPRHKDRNAAARAWKTLAPNAELRTKIAEDVKRRLAEDADWLRGAIPYPATYLNGARWNDEITPAVVGRVAPAAGERPYTPC